MWCSTISYHDVRYKFDFGSMSTLLSHWNPIYQLKITLLLRNTNSVRWTWSIRESIWFVFVASSKLKELTEKPRLKCVLAIGFLPTGTQYAFQRVKQCNVYSSCFQSLCSFSLLPCLALPCPHLHTCCFWTTNVIITNLGQQKFHRQMDMQT